MDEEFNRRHAKESYETQFIRMRTEIERMVDEGMTFKKSKKVKKFGSNGQ